MDGFDLDLNLDMITIVGVVSDIEKLKSIIEDITNIQLTPANPSSRFMYNKAWRMGKHAFFEIDTLKKNARVDFNPSKLDNSSEVFVYSVLSCMKEKEFTRIDLALDFTGIDFSREWKMRDYKSRKIGYWLSGSTERLETCYAGTRNSDSQVILYNKILEQMKEFNVLLRDDQIGEKELEVIAKQKQETKESHWWRIEERIRGGKAKNWRNYNWFEGIVLIKLDSVPIFPEGTKHSTKADVLTCLNYPDFIEGYANSTQAKIRTVIKELKYKEDEVHTPSDLLKYKKISLIFEEIKGQLENYISLGANQTEK
ncbi:hypothetical protein [Bacillus cereus group sp. BfR-BA-02730]|uniref:hypothetical protein n=1 Tax=Bacillus cereus group sp. BfR-BA-02730 TaxID=3094893 RepID=UPI0029C27EF1|nr:hypothetical protein [Bacillus cereus group sp. BfR-BA-02730]MDX5813387.1 hypothetical protein [Bacillus cereus group sp. BfR-BA-02730]